MMMFKSNCNFLKNLSFKFYHQNMANKNAARKINGMLNIKNTNEKRYHGDPSQLVRNDLQLVFTDIKKRLNNGTNQNNLMDISTYYCEAIKGDAIGVVLALLLAKALNSSTENPAVLEDQQKKAAFLEMIVSASLFHDDLIDNASIRGGKTSVNLLWNPQQVVFGGVYIFSVANNILSELNPEVSIMLSSCFKYMSQGEFMQFYTKDSYCEKFEHYLDKTCRKTGMLIADCLKGIALVSDRTEKKELSKFSYEYGKKLGMALQITNDCMDLTGKFKEFGINNDIAGDLRDGHATAPILFAAKEFSQLNTMITRRFKAPGDVEKTLNLVNKSNAFEETKNLVDDMLSEAKSSLSVLNKSPYRICLQNICDSVSSSIVTTVNDNQ